MRWIRRRCRESKQKKIQSYQRPFFHFRRLYEFRSRKESSTKERGLIPRPSSRGPTAQRTTSAILDDFRRQEGKAAFPSSRVHDVK